MKVLFFMTAKYPTHKAYGVTTGETARALRLAGNSVEIWTLLSSESDELIDQYGNKVISFDYSNLVRLRNALWNSRLLGPLAFVMSSIFVTRKAIPMLLKEPKDVIWFRDVYVAYKVSRRTNAQVVLEIHQWPNNFRRKLLRVMARKSNVIFLTIRKSTYQKMQSKFPEAVICYSPMGVSSKFIEEGSKRFSNPDVKFYKLPLKICYVGRLFSSGHDNGVTKLIENWNLVSRDKARLTIIGISRSELSNLKKSLNLDSIEFLGNIDHVEVPKLLSTYDVGIIPYEESNYNAERFPIKAVEYCAAGVNVVAADTSSLQEVLGSDFAYFYNPRDPLSLVKCIDLIINNKKEALKKSHQGHMWAEGYTYESRLKSVYPILGGRNS